MKVEFKEYPGADGLSPQQYEIVVDIVSGSTIKEIALRLGISVKTVEYHWKRIQELLKVHSYVELVWYSIKRGWASLGR